MAGAVTGPAGPHVALLEAVLPGLLEAGPLQVSLLSGGRSNLTYRVTDGHRTWVLRRPPLGQVQATAHDMGREFRLLRALHPTAVPVPRPCALLGPEVLGVPAYLMEFVAGEILRDRAQLDAVAGPPAHRLAEALVDVLAELHAIHPAAVGLGDLGRPAGYLERQLSRWSGQLDSLRRSLDGEAGAVCGLDELHRLGARLAARAPASSRNCLIHGDFRLDNVVVQLAQPVEVAVVGVLDWELATRGDPLADLASALIWWDGFAGLDSPVAAVPGDVPGFPAGEVLARRYAQVTGADLSLLPWYLGFAYFKVSVIFAGIHARAVRGLTVGDGFDRLGPLIPDLVVRAGAHEKEMSRWT